MAYHTSRLFDGFEIISAVPKYQLGWSVYGNILIYYTNESGEQMDEAEMRKIAKKRAGFKRHAFFYIIIMIFLAIVNVATTPDVIWIGWPVLGWGFALSIHAFSTYAGSSQTLEESEYLALKNKQ